MFDEPNESPQERTIDPAQRAKDKSDEFRVHAEVCAVFEGPRKFDAQILSLKADLARDIQKRMARLEKSKAADSPILPPESAADAAALLNLSSTEKLSSNDYHIYRRPGELMIVRWLEADQIEIFYERLQAHFDVALDDFKNEQREAFGWKQDAKMTAFLGALDAIDVKMPDRYLREIIRKHSVFVLSTLTADEMDISHLTETVMGSEVADVVGPASAPPDDPTERDRAWFFKLFSLRGMFEGVERMCFFTYMQKAEDTFEGD
jgi:hypothetical protein